MFYPTFDNTFYLEKLINIILLLGYIYQFSVLTSQIFLWFLAYIIILIFFEWKFLFNCNNFHYSLKFDDLRFINKYFFFLIVISTFSNIYILFFVIGIDKNLLKKENYILGFVVFQNICLILVFLFSFLKSKTFMRLFKEVTNEFENLLSKYLKNKINMGDKIIEQNKSNYNINNENNSNGNIIIENNNPEQNQQMQEISIPIPAEDI